MHFCPSQEGKEWCTQCESRKTADGARLCRDRFCKLKDLLPADGRVGFSSATPIARPVDVDPEIIERVERARAASAPSKVVIMTRAKQARRTNLSNKEERLLNAMRQRADRRTGEVAVSFNDVYDEISVASPSCVSPLMQALVERKMITIIERRGGRSKTRYLIHGFAEKPPLGERPAFAEDTPDLRASIGERRVFDDEVVPPPAIDESAPETKTPTAVCATCIFGRIRGVGDMICRRYPVGWQPKVDPADWCGEWKIDK